MGAEQLVQPRTVLGDIGGKVARDADVIELVPRPDVGRARLIVLVGVRRRVAVRIMQQRRDLEQLSDSKTIGSVEVLEIELDAGFDEELLGDRL